MKRIKLTPGELDAAIRAAVLSSNDTNRMIDFTLELGRIFEEYPDGEYQGFLLFEQAELS